jgi:hypothetical protein
MGAWPDGDKEEEEEEEVATSDTTHQSNYQLDGAHKPELATTYTACVTGIGGRRKRGEGEGEGERPVFTLEGANQAALPPKRSTASRTDSNGADVSTSALPPPPPTPSAATGAAAHSASELMRCGEIS